LNLLVSEEFQSFAKLLSPACPLPASSNTTKSWLIGAANEVKLKLKNELIQFKGGISATIDIWTDSSLLRSYVEMEELLDAKIILHTNY
jgi:hypothetical protein